MLYFVLLFLCVIAYLASRRNPKSQKILAVLFLSAMMLIVGMRDTSVGVDSERYADKLEYVRDVSLSSYEPLFQLSINIINANWGTVLAWFMYFSLLTYSLYTISVLKYSTNPILTVLIFMVSIMHFFPDTMNNLRQGISMMFLLLSYLYAAERKYLITIPLFLLALGFHMSALMVLPFYFINYHDFSKKTITLVLSFSFFFGLIAQDWFDASSLFSGLSFASETLMEGYDRFSDYTSGNRVLNAAGMLSFMTPANILCFLLIPQDNDEKTYKYLFNFYFWGIVIGNLVLRTISFGIRFMVLFVIVESLLVTYKYKENIIIRYSVAFMVILYCVYLIGISNNHQPGMIIPYIINPEVFNIL